MNSLARNLTVALVFLAMTSTAQTYPPIGGIPTQYNGAFAGEAGSPRAALYTSVMNTSPNWFNSGPRIFTLVSIDHFFKTLRSGVGITAGYSTNRHYEGRQLGVAWSPKFSVKGRYTIAPFVDYRLSNSYMQAVSPNFKGQIFDIFAQSMRAGFLINNAKSYIGITASIWDEVRDGVTDTIRYSRLFKNMAYSVQAGRTYKSTPESDFAFTPQLMLNYTRWRTHFFGNGIDQFTLSYSLIVNYKKFLTGINNEGIVLGYQTERFKLQFINWYGRAVGGVRFDFGTPLIEFSPIGATKDTYTGSLSLRYIFKKKSSLKMSGF